MASAVNKFNDRPLEHRAHIVTGHGEHIDCVLIGQYVYHFYSIDNNLIMVQYSCKLEKTTDIWMIEYRQLDYFIQDINIDDVWEKARK